MDERIESYLAKLPDGGDEFDPYFVPDDWARLQYGRILWKNPKMRRRLIAHWQDTRHPWHDRFEGERRELVEELLCSQPSDNERLDSQWQEKGASLRAVMREIPPVFGSFF